MSFVEKMCDRLVAIVGACLFVQLPLFMEAYMQQLQGRVAELQRQQVALMQVARQSGKTLEQFVQKSLASSDPDFSAQGHLLQVMLNRYATLKLQLSHLQSALPWQKPFYFFSELNWEVAQSTFSHFSMGLPLTWEAALYALLGMLLGWGVLYLCKRLFAFLFSAVVKGQQ